MNAADTNRAGQRWLREHGASGKVKGRKKRDRLRYSVAVAISRAENHNSKFKPWNFAKMWRMLNCPEAMALYSELDRINKTGEKE